MEEVVILSSARTPIGKYKGSLAQFSAMELGRITVSQAIKKAKIEPNEIDQVFIGNVLQAGNGQNIARQIAINSNIPYEVPATTINEVCGSGLKAIILAMQQIQLGRADVVVAGGTESMSQAPELKKFDYITDEWQLPFSSMIYDGLTDAFSYKHMGFTAENVADNYSIKREQMDQFSFYSQKKAIQASQNGKFANEIVPIEITKDQQLKIDEGIRLDTKLEKIASLKPVFKENGKITAGNASTLSDGAATLVLSSKSYAIKNGLDYLATINEYSEVGIDPDLMGISPIQAVQQLLERQQKSIKDIDLFEINEAFSATSIVVQEKLQLPAEKVNIYGGSIALGHPLGATGARIVTTLLSELYQEKKHSGIASLCIGGGLGLALMITKNKQLEEHENKGKKFYQLTNKERLNELVKLGKLTDEEARQLEFETVLPEKISNNMIENQISEVAIPLGIAQNFVINDKKKWIPMATEEPSVIAAASNAAKIIANSGGIQSQAIERQMIGQIVLKNVTDYAKTQEKIIQYKEQLFDTAKEAYPSIYQRGGGLKDLKIRTFKDQNYLSIDLSVDVKDAMGANILNTILEKITQKLHELLPDIDVLFSILSNYAVRSLVKASCTIPVNKLGKDVAEKIVSASEYAKIDSYRAVTHNKGIMNGIDAVVLATGNDTRAVAAASHAYAAKNGNYEGLTTWQFDQSQENIIGELVLPMAVGIHGGATNLLPKAKLSLKLLEVKNASELAEIIVAVGLAQNLAAIKALVTDGIQKGHMALQSRSLAIQAGAQENEIKQVTQRLKKAEHINLATAKEILATLRQN
ncbi:hydroxymethylglutaryl-CoA reductase, degradative [Melissococcus plutonius]|uniref:hydroxymethylglutaryl-CoA reductase, degradative n=1 Tax=Melissococcus plutonius TaxID=33970 RepID=UPI003C2EB2C6